jgi:hypothetical protein
MRTFVIALIALLGLTGLSSAATISYADAVTQLAANCGADIQKLCKGLNLGNNRIGNCLAEKAAQVSPQCTSTLSLVMASITERRLAQTSVATLCRDDAARRCEGIVPGEAHLLTCLLKAAKSVSAKCNQAITNAGWR